MVHVRHTWWVKMLPRLSWAYVQPKNKSKRTHSDCTVSVNKSICYNNFFWLAPLDPQNVYCLLRGTAVISPRFWYLLHGWNWIVYVQQSPHFYECTNTSQTSIPCLGACYIEVYSRCFKADPLVNQIVRSVAWMAVDYLLQTILETTLNCYWTLLSAHILFWNLGGSSLETGTQIFSTPTTMQVWVLFGN